jgi:hypothetical protein
MNEIIIKEDPALPALPTTVLPAIEQLVAALGIPRSALVVA